ncbi:Cyclic nucleotide-binding protein [Pseudocohnilembus persalinus]|uniref:Cyclic nucleotide-binding protein n=1 Tax=Pseudocohnilembus persalinus TaxID=266149 RepID=A0A0V0R3Y8_PSEPJ|nr:Cyclic nucleotide-binding protein [Pseudocohnilembus persalinus]|eukprot:KRX09204.1 Cyclic nucleotide-binding protein [Pseudocohnilembus persalinus]
MEDAVEKKYWEYLDNKQKESMEELENWNQKLQKNQLEYEIIIQKIKEGQTYMDIFSNSIQLMHQNKQQNGENIFGMESSKLKPFSNNQKIGSDDHMFNANLLNSLDKNNSQLRQVTSSFKSISDIEEVEEKPYINQQEVKIGNQFQSQSVMNQNKNNTSVNQQFKSIQNKPDIYEFVMDEKNNFSGNDSLSCRYQKKLEQSKVTQKNNGFIDILFKSSNSTKQMLSSLPLNMKKSKLGCSSENLKGGPALIEIILKETRRKLEINFAHQILKQFSLFQKYPQILENEDNLKLLLQKMQIEYQPKNTCLFQVGDRGDKLYIVLKGSVYLLIEQLNPKQNTHKAKLQTKNSNLKNDLQSDNSDFESKNDCDNDNLKKDTKVLDYKNQKQQEKILQNQENQEKNKRKNKDDKGNLKIKQKKKKLTSVKDLWKIKEPAEGAFQQLKQKISKNKIEQAIKEEFEGVINGVNSELLTYKQLCQKFDKILPHLRVPLLIKGQNTYFGEDEILNKEEIRNHQVIVESETCELYAINSKILIKLLKDYYTLNNFLEEYDFNRKQHEQIEQKVQKNVQEYLPLVKQLGGLQKEKPFFLNQNDKNNQQINGIQSQPLIPNQLIQIDEQKKKLDLVISTSQRENIQSLQLITENQYVNDQHQRKILEAENLEQIIEEEKYDFDKILSGYNYTQDQLCEISKKKLRTNEMYCNQEFLKLKQQNAFQKSNQKMKTQESYIENGSFTSPRYGTKLQSQSEYETLISQRKSAKSISFDQKYAKIQKNILKDNNLPQKNDINQQESQNIQVQTDLTERYINNKNDYEQFKKNKSLVNNIQHEQTLDVRRS